MTGLEPGVIAGIGAATSAVGAGSSIVSGISQNQAAQNASEASSKVSKISSNFAAQTAFFHNQLNEELAQKLHTNQVYATDTEAALMEFNADTLDLRAESAARRAALIEKRMDFILKSGDMQAGLYNAAAGVMRAKSEADEMAAASQLAITEEEVGAFRRKFDRSQSTAIALAGFSGVSGIVPKLLFENEIEAEQTSRMMRLAGYDKYMQLSGAAGSKRMEALQLEGQGIQAKAGAAFQAIQAMEQALDADGEATNDRISAILTRATAQSMRLGVVYQPPMLESVQSVEAGKSYAPSGWGDIASGVSKGFSAVEKAMDYFSKTGGTGSVTYIDNAPKTVNWGLSSNSFVSGAERVSANY